MKYILKTGKIYVGYMVTVWGYYFIHTSEVTNNTIQYWKNNILNN